MYDAKNQVLIYLAHASELSEGSAKMSMSTVPLLAGDAGASPAD
ncbi:CreA family protein [Paracoccus sp. (in: a-proteobacteria)]